MLVVDNYIIHKSRKVERWLATNKESGCCFCRRTRRG
jgi:hypothetical protein